VGSVAGSLAGLRSSSIVDGGAGPISFGLPKP